MGVTLGCFANDVTIADELSKSASRALGHLIGKTKCGLELGYESFSKLYHACVVPTLDYASGAWCVGNTVNCDKLDKVHMRAIRFFIGVPRNAAIHGYIGDIGWVPGVVRHDIKVLQLFDQIVSMEPMQLTRKIYEYDRNLGLPNTWSENVKAICSVIGCEENWDNNVPINLAHARESLQRMYERVWVRETAEKPKLSTYSKIKNDMNTAPFI